MPIAIAESFYGILVVDEDKNIVWEWKHDFGIDGGTVYGLDYNGDTFMVGSQHRIFEVNKIGNIIWKRVLFRGLHSLQITPDDTILVTTSTFDKVIELDKEKGIIWEWRAEDHFTPPPDYNLETRGSHTHTWDWTHLNHAWRLDNGTTLIGLYHTPVAHRPGESDDGCILLVDKDGSIIWSWGAGVTKNQHFVLPYETSFICADSANRRIIKFTPDEGVILEKRLEHIPLGLDIDSDGNIYATMPMLRKVVKLDTDFNLVWEYRKPIREMDGRIYQVKCIENFDLDLSPEDEKLVEERLKRLGYL